MLTRPDVLLRMEAFLVLLAILVGYSMVLHGSWLGFAVLFLAPDLSLLGYAAKGHGGMAAALYNAVHSYTLPVVLGLIAWRSGNGHLGEVAAIWAAHIAFDRMLGFGLKFREGFKPTHVQRAGVWGNALGG